MSHVPVLLKEVIHYLNPQPNENFIDATIGEAGHTMAILDKNKPNGKVLGIEINPDLFQKLQRIENEDSKLNVKERLIVVNDSYANLKEIVRNNNVQPIHGIIFDLGICSWQIESSGKGFSYQKDEPLDMRFNPNQDLTAAEIINFWEIEKIEQILREYGEERYSHRIVVALKEARKKERIVGTQQLVDLLKKTLPKNYDNRRIHFATRVFQALRIAVNKELENIEEGLKQAVQILEPKGKIVVISFHSLEDRIAKRFFKEQEKNNELQILTKKPISPSIEEIKKNPRSRSAKLRAAQIN
ncbi:MAG: 16S rRNA (cytosine(1402)-N(4))-methyltransferase RsmH [Candidatus Pacebacteria bacterium]|jgi:16S rRNA (cytosine1402-N4)-methyltransferase|nr:16S rRNA (cytosine(1402)-N(4))-methyltransferase RsmH [Candidatus Paceibacterota bacterium]MDD4994817.1 16S rRNA (cytosine(1402)-N(4))-methyltransferase RsmH [Candidatus Paceibacterota bacterium]MDD5535516.1 16S rRNA (cytosine(1402)-N(4))-methyltransferase RsmH [Candidatus Paceibacterota bacterium]